MSNEVIVHKSRTNTLRVNLGINVAADILTSEIRSEPDPDSTLIAEWDVAFVTDGTDGRLVLSLDDSVTSLITYTTGYMDIKRVSAGEPIPVFDRPLEVIFREVVTA